MLLQLIFKNRKKRELELFKGCCCNLNLIKVNMKIIFFFRKSFKRINFLSRNSICLLAFRTYFFLFYLFFLRHVCSSSVNHTFFSFFLFIHVINIFKKAKMLSKTAATATTLNFAFLFLKYSYSFLFINFY